MLQKVKTYKILVEARDHGDPSLSSTATINIVITDSNTHAPVFNNTKVRICKTVIQCKPLDKWICWNGYVICSFTAVSTHVHSIK